MITEKANQNREWVIVIALLLLVILFRLPSLEQPFDNDSGANAYHARLIVRGEPLYGTHHPAHHLPAAYYTYALAFLLFGDSVWAVKFLLILWTIATVYLLYRTGTLLMDRATGLLAAFFYIILSSNVDLFGTTAEIEQFANLPRVAAVWAIVRLTSRRRVASWKFVFVGLLSAGAFLFKAVYLSPLAMVCYMLLLELWRNRKSPDSWKETLMRGAWVGLGFVAGLSLTVAYFATLGSLPRLLLVFTLGQEYMTYRIVNSLVSRYWPLLPFIGLGKSNIVLLVCSLCGFGNDPGSVQEASFRARRRDSTDISYFNLVHLVFSRSGHHPHLFFALLSAHCSCLVAAGGLVFIQVLSPCHKSSPIWSPSNRRGHTGIIDNNRHVQQHQTKHILLSLCPVQVRIRYLSGFCLGWMACHRARVGTCAKTGRLRTRAYFAI